MYSKEALQAKLAQLSATKQALLEKKLSGEVQELLEQNDDTISRRDLTQESPLSFSQQRLWLLHQLDEHSSAYNEPQIVRLTGEIDLDALEKSFVEIVNRHEVLRTTFHMGKNGPVQTIQQEFSFELLVDHLETLPDDQEKQDRLDQIIKQEIETPFYLAADLPWRVRVIQPENDTYIVVLTFHHIACDGWSIGVFTEELIRLYMAFSNGQPSPLPKLDIQYADFSAWQRQQIQGEKLDKLLDYWHQQIAGLPVLQLPTDRPRPPVQSMRGAVKRIALSEALTQQIKSFSQTHDVTIFMTLLAGFKTLLHRYTSQEDIAIGSLIANRNHRQLEPLIGFFVNNLVMRTDLSGQPSFKDLVTRVSKTAIDAYAHQDLPFDFLAEEQARDPSRTPIFQTLFIWQNTPKKPLKLPGLEVAPLFVHTNTAKFDLSLYMEEIDGRVQGLWEYNSDLFEPTTIERMAKHLENLLAAGIADPHTPIMHLPMLTDQETQLLSGWNHTHQSFPLEQVFPTLFENQVEKTPNKIAVQDGAQTWTYAQLNNMSNQFAHILMAHGVQANSIVALLAERSIDLLVAILATFKAGGAYLPLDPHYPPTRIVQILTQSQPTVILHQKAFEAVLTEAFAEADKQIPLQEIEINDIPAPNLPVHCAPDDLAYVIFTSGSTGKPKGAMVQQKGMINHLYAKITDLVMNDEDRMAQTASQCFDISVWQFLAALLSGGRVHIFNDLVVRDPAVLINRLVEERITVMEVVPSLMRVLLQEVQRQGNKLNLSHLRWQIPTGEALPPELVREWFAHFPDIPLVNAYGPTECSDDVTHYFIHSAPPEHIINMPIGRPIANMQIHILDAFMQPVPIGVTGHIWVGGVGVGCGYLNDAARTDAVFMADPFVENGRLYKTGDLGRYLPDGNIEFLGRADFQVKIRGFRIELGEIETRIVEHPAVKECVLVAQKDKNQQNYLAAYLVAEVGQELILDHVQQHLKKYLPDYMMPATFTVLKKIPLTANGKINRRALPEPNHQISVTRRQKPYIPPRNNVEKQMLSIWENLLGISPISIDDDFFHLNGHSLLAIRLIAEMQESFDYRVPVATFFQNPTIAGIAAIIQQQQLTNAPAEWSPLVTLQAEGSQSPLFFINSTPVTPHQFHRLTQTLAVDRPVYALQMPGIDGTPSPLPTVPELAAHYLDYIQRYHDGPYILCGHSFGGLIAFEMAHQLTAQNKEVHLMILDMVAPVYKPHHEHYQTIDMVTETMGIIEKLFNVSLEFKADDNTNETAEKTFIQALKEHHILPTSTDDAYIQNLFATQKAIHKAIDAYPAQAKPLTHTLHLFKAAQIRPDPIPPEIAQLYADDYLGWQALIRGTIHCVTVMGNHFSMLQAPYVQDLAKAINMQLGNWQQ